MSAPEFSRPVRADTIGLLAHRVAVEASAQERAALARRFGIAAIEQLDGIVDLARVGDDIVATGRIAARVQQACVATGEPVAARIDTPFVVHFRPEPAADAGDDDLELDEGEMDVIFLEDDEVNVGEAVAQTLALSLDPYPRAPGAAAALAEAGVRDHGTSGAFDALAALKDRLGGERRG